MLLYVKATHIVFVVSWFAGLFYLVRLFVYHVEARGKPEPEKAIIQAQLQKMAELLWRAITVPAMVLTLLTGATMLYLAPGYLHQPWMLAKLAFVVALVVYHTYCGRLVKAMPTDAITMSGNTLRMFNEVATVLLVAIVFLVVLKSMLSMLWGVIGLFIFIIVIFTAVRFYRSYRNKSAS
jgi:putative membrane protein